MPNDNDGSKYKSLIKVSQMHLPTRTALTRGLQYLACHLGGAMSTESTVAVGYWQKKLYVAKLGRVGIPTNYVEDLEALLSSPLDEDTEEKLSAFEDDGEAPIEGIIGVGGGRTGLHAEMMLVKQLGVVAWGAQFYYGVAIAASQGACPACAGFMNMKNIWHTGVRASGRVSTRWLNPIDSTFCGTEVGLGLYFPDVNVGGAYAWQADF